MDAIWILEFLYSFISYLSTNPDCAFRTIETRLSYQAFQRMGLSSLSVLPHLIIIYKDFFGSLLKTKLFLSLGSRPFGNNINRVSLTMAARYLRSVVCGLLASSSVSFSRCSKCNIANCQQITLVLASPTVERTSGLERRDGIIPEVLPGSWTSLGCYK